MHQKNIQVPLCETSRVSCCKPRSKKNIRIKKKYIIVVVVVAGGVVVVVVVVVVGVVVVVVVVVVVPRGSNDVLGASLLQKTAPAVFCICVAWAVQDCAEAWLLQ